MTENKILTNLHTRTILIIGVRHLLLIYTIFIFLFLFPFPIPSFGWLVEPAKDLGVGDGAAIFEVGEGRDDLSISGGGNFSA